MHAEWFYSPYCPACRQLMDGAVPDADAVVSDVTRHLERAAGLGVTELPALVVDGRLLAQGAAAVRLLQRVPGQAVAP